MVNTNSGKSDTQDVQDKERLDERQAEATSDKTLGDLEQAETDTGSTNTQSNPGPSPDGVVDESDELKDAGPM